VTVQEPRIDRVQQRGKTQASFAGNAPWLLEDRLRLAGANYIAKAALQDYFAAIVRYWLDALAGSSKGEIWR